MEKKKEDDDEVQFGPQGKYWYDDGIPGKQIFSEKLFFLI